MRLIACCFLYSILSSNLFAQAIDYNTIILPSNARNVGIEEKLVQLAWNNNPENRIEENNLLIASKAVKLNYAEWLNIFAVRLNANEYTINPEAIGDRNYFYPRYNFSATISLGMFVDIPAKTKISKIEVSNQEERINLKKLQMRSEVLKRYQNYKVTKEMVKIQANFTDDAYSNFLIAEQQFKNGNITIEEYNENLKMYDQQLINKLQRESAFEIAQIDLEELIGVRIEDVIQQDQ